MRTATRILIAALGVFLNCDNEERPASFEYIHTTILSPACATAGCHSTFGEVFGFRFDRLDETYTILTGGTCDDGPLDSYVMPGFPDQSRLIDFLRADNVRRRMPPDRPLPEKDIRLIERWIENGALCD